MADSACICRTLIVCALLKQPSVLSGQKRAVWWSARDTHMLTAASRDWSVCEGRCAWRPDRPAKTCWLDGNGSKEKDGAFSITRPVWTDARCWDKDKLGFPSVKDWTHPTILLSFPETLSADNSTGSEAPFTVQRLQGWQLYADPAGRCLTVILPFAEL